MFISKVITTSIILLMTTRCSFGLKGKHLKGMKKVKAREFIRDIIPEIVEYPLPSKEVYDNISIAVMDVDLIGPTSTPSSTPSNTPSMTPSATPSTTPSTTPSATPSATPSMTPSATPSSTPSMTPSATPSSTPSLTPSTTPSSTPSVAPISSTAAPSKTPSASPSLEESSFPSTFVVTDMSEGEEAIETSTARDEEAERQESEAIGTETAALIFAGALTSLVAIGYFTVNLRCKNRVAEDMPEDMTIFSRDSSLHQLGIEKRAVVRPELFQQQEHHGLHEV